MKPSILTSWHTVPADGVCWQVAPELRDVLLGDAGLRLPEWLRDGRATIVKEGPHRVVYRVQLSIDQSFYIKHNLLPDVRAWLRQLVRPSKARMELDRALTLANRGVSTIEPLALGERQSPFGACESFLVTRSLDDAHPLNSFMATVLVGYPARRQTRIRQRLAAALGRFVATMHAAGIRHDDFHPANILVEMSGDDRPKLYVIDLNAVHVGPPLSWPVSHDNLALLTRWFAPRSSRADRLRFWRAYYEDRGFGIWPRGPGRHREHFDHAREIEAKALHSVLAFWKGRDRRSLVNNTYFRRVCRVGVVGHAVADIDPQLLARLLANPDAPFQEPGVRLLKDSPSSTVAELEVVSSGKTRRLVYKRFRATAWSDPWTSLVRLSPALRSWINGHGLRDRCLPTARPLLVLHRVGTGMKRDGYMLAEKIDNAVDLRTFMSQLANSPVDRARRQLRLAIDKVAHAVRQLHRCRLSHRDLKAGNVLIGSNLERRPFPFERVEGVPAGAPIASYLPMPASDVWFIDLVGVSRHKRLSRSRRVQNLARLHASFYHSSELTRSDKLRFLRSYLLWNVVGKGAWKSWWKAIARATGRKAARNAKRGRVLA